MVVINFWVAQPYLDPPFYVSLRVGIVGGGSLGIYYCVYSLIPKCSFQVIIYLESPK